MQIKILLLADINSPHIEKWALALSGNGHTVGLFSLVKSSRNWHTNNKNIFLIYEPYDFVDPSSLIDKLKYLSKLPLLNRKLKEFKPDILHAHYATSYGLLGSLSGFHPFVLSVWGSDVFEFPHKSILHKLLFKLNLKQADRILSTSYAMRHELELYTNSNIEVTPFGVNTDTFYPRDVKNEEEKGILYLGIIKSIEEMYGIKTIIEAIQILKYKLPNLKFKFLFIGKGSRIDYYKQRIKDLDLTDNVCFIGNIPTENIPYYHNLLDVYLNVSNVNESFGVSVIEAMACGKPVIVSDALGLIEIVSENTGIIIEKNNVSQLVDAITKLIESPDQRLKLGQEARKYVKAYYELEYCTGLMINIYESILNKNFKDVLLWNKK